MQYLRISYSILGYQYVRHDDESSHDDESDSEASQKSEDIY